MRSSGDYYVTVVEDTNLGEIVATATLIIEHKFTHSCAKVCVRNLNQKKITVTISNKVRHFWRLSLMVFPGCFQRGRIEDVVVSGECRGKQLGKL